MCVRTLGGDSSFSFSVAVFASEDWYYCVQVFYLERGERSGGFGVEFSPKVNVAEEGGFTRFVFSPVLVVPLLELGLAKNKEHARETLAHSAGDRRWFGYLSDRVGTLVPSRERARTDSLTLTQQCGNLRCSLTVPNGR